MSSRAKRLPATTAKGERADPFVSLQETRDLLSGPLPVLLVAGDGTVLGGNGLGAWLCQRPSILALLLQNIYAVSGQALSEDWIPRACNTRFIKRKLRVLKRIDPQMAWPAHRAFAEAVRRARADQRPKVCPVASCAQVPEHVEWRYPLCIRRPDHAPSAAPDDILQFVASDLAISRDDVDELGDPISELTARYVVVFEPVDATTKRVVAEVRRQMEEGAAEYAYPPASDVDYFVKQRVESLRLIISNHLRKMTPETESSLPRGDPKASPGRQERTTQELVDLHPGEWIALRVTEYDQDDWPAKGVVLGHSPDRVGLSKALAQDFPAGTHYVFQAVPHLDAGPEYDQAVKEFVAEFAAAKVAAGAGRTR